MKMLRIGTLCIVLLIFNSRLVFAQAAADIDPFGFGPTPASQLPFGTTSPVEEPNAVEKPEAADSVIKPILRLTLSATRNSKPALVSMPSMVSGRQVVYESAIRDGKQVQVPRTVTVQVPYVVESVTEGGTLIDCDDIDLRVHKSEAGERSFEFDIKGELLLRNGTSLIQAKSAQFKDGKLTLTEVQITATTMTMSSREVVLDLDVKNVNIGPVTDAVQSTSLPPSNTFPSFDLPPVNTLPQASSIPQSQPALKPAPGNGKAVLLPTFY